MKRIHLIAGFPSGGALKQTYKTSNKDEVIILKDYLSIGPLLNFDDEKSLLDRTIYFKNIYKEIKEDNNYYLYQDEIGFSPILGIKNTNNPIFYYYSNSTNEQIYLRAICYLLKDFNIYAIDVNKVLNNANIISTNELSPETFSKLIKKPILLNNSQKQLLADEYKNLMTYNFNLRIFNNNVINNLNEDFFDKIIINKLSTKYEPALIICSKVCNSINYEISDLFIIYRIMILIKNHKIKANNNNSKISNINIKLY